MWSKQSDGRIDIVEDEVTEAGTEGCSCRALEAFVRTVAFPVSEMGNHWNILVRGVIQSGLGNEGLWMCFISLFGGKRHLKEGN